MALGTATGGFALSNSNSFTSSFERIVQENSTYYVLGFNSSQSARNGRFVPVKVSIKRPGLHVRAREGYLAPLGPAAPPEPEPAPVLRAMAAPVSIRGIGLHVAAVPFKGSGREASVALAVEIDVPTLGLEERDGIIGGELDLTYTAVDARNRAYPGARHAMTLSLTPERYEEVAGTGLRMVSQLALPPGRYQVRVAAQSGQRTGSIVYDMEVPDFGRGQLLMSGLALTSDAAARTLTGRPPPPEAGDRRAAVRCRPPSCVIPLAETAPSGDDPLHGVLPAPMTTVREFDRGDTVMLYAEVYQNLPRSRSRSDCLPGLLRPRSRSRPPTASSSGARVSAG